MISLLYLNLIINNFGKNIEDSRIKAKINFRLGAGKSKLLIIKCIWFNTNL